MHKFNKIISPEPALASLPVAIESETVTPKVIGRSVPQSPPKNVNRNNRLDSTFINLFKKLKPLTHPTSSTLTTDALAKIALSNINALSKSNTPQEQHQFLSEAKHRLAHITGMNAEVSERAESIATIALDLSSKLKDQSILPIRHGEALRILVRLLAPSELKNTKFESFANINNSNSPLVSKEVRSQVLANLQQAWPYFNVEHQQDVINLTLDQFENQGIDPSTQETLLNFLAQEALSAPESLGSHSKNKYRADQVWRALNVIDNTIMQARNFSQLCTLETSLSNGLCRLEKNTTANRHNATQSALSDHFTLASEILDTILEMQASTSKGKQIGLDKRLAFRREERAREIASKRWSATPSLILGSSPSSSGS